MADIVTVLASLLSLCKKNNVSILASSGSAWDWSLQLYSPSQQEFVVEKNCSQGSPEIQTEGEKQRGLF